MPLAAGPQIIGWSRYVLDQLRLVAVRGAGAVHDLDNDLLRRTAILHLQPPIVVEFEVGGGFQIGWADDAPSFPSRALAAAMRSAVDATPVLSSTPKTAHPYSYPASVW